MTTTMTKPTIQTFVATISNDQARELAGATFGASTDPARVILTRVMLDWRQAGRLALVATDSYVAVKRVVKPEQLVIEDYGYKADRKHATVQVDAKALREALNKAAATKLPMPAPVVLSLDSLAGEAYPLRLTVGTVDQSYAATLQCVAEHEASYPQTERFVGGPFNISYEGMLWAFNGAYLEGLLKTRASTVGVRDRAHNQTVRMCLLDGEGTATNLKPLSLTTPFKGDPTNVYDDPSWVGTIMPVRV